MLTNKNKGKNQEVLVLEDEFKVNKTSLASDLLNLEKVRKIEIETTKVPDIETQEILIKNTDNFLNLHESQINIPVEMIVFPFFTPQKQNKKVNFKYIFEDLGVTMSSTLIAKSKEDKVFQPSIFEEKIYTFLISMYQSRSQIEKNNENSEEIPISFEISDFIVNFLGNKMNRTYYTKVEQALKNLKSTEYQFEISNHSKFGENKFEDKEFKLLSYQKIKTGKKIYYNVYLNKNIIKKLKEKRYIKYNTKNLLEIMTKDPIASRIYKYISKVRYEKNKGSINIRTLAAIIPLKIEQYTTRETKKGIKQYVLNRMKPVLARILKAFEVLTEMRYLTSYEERYVRAEDTYFIDYIFNRERDGDCHVSEFVKKEKGKYKEEIDGEEVIIDLEAEIKNENIENIELLIKNIKESSNLKSLWNKRVDNKMNKILLEDGEIILKRILYVLKDLDSSEIKLSLVKYIDGILKNIRKNKENQKNYSLFQNAAKGKAGKSKKAIIEKRKKDMEKIKNFDELQDYEKNLKNVKDDLENKKKIKEEDIFSEKNSDTKKIEVKENNNILPVESTVKKLLENFDELTRIEIEKKALELLGKETEKKGGTSVDTKGLAEIKKVSEAMYYNMLNRHIFEVIRDEYMDKIKEN